MLAQLITEKAGLTTTTGNRWKARLLAAPIWGSSGYYSTEVVARDGARAFPVGTPIFWDHPSKTEAEDRPERSVRDLAGKITTTPLFEGDGLYATVEFYGHAAGIVAEMADDIGLSIRATANIGMGNAAGRYGRIVTALLEGASVDLVTKAGAGGKLVELLESAASGSGPVKPKRTRDAWGRPIVEKTRTTPWGRPNRERRLTRDIWGDPIDNAAREARTRRDAWGDPIN